MPAATPDADHRDPTPAAAASRAGDAPRGRDHAPGRDARFRWSRDGGLAALVVAVALLVFARGLGNGFVFDDVPIIAEDPRLDAPFDLGPILTQGYWPASAADTTNLWRPLTTWSFALGRAIHGPGPAGVLAINWLLNAVASLLVFALACRTLGRRDLALVAGLAFAAHPVHVEVVSNGVGRGELLAAVFGLAAILLHLRWLDDAEAAHDAPVRPARDETTGARRHWRFAAALGCAALAMLAKESAATLPGVIFLCDWLGREGGRLRPMLAPARLVGYLAYGLPLAAVLAGRAEAIGFAAPQVAIVLEGAAPWQRIVLALDVLVAQVAQLAVPVRLAAEYSDFRHLARDLAPAAAVLPVVAVLALAAATILAWRAGASDRPGATALRNVALGVWFLLLAGLATSNLLVPIGTIRGDRLLYLPSAGFVLALGGLVGALLPRAGRGRGIVAVIAALVVLAYGARSFVRLPAWRTEEALVRATVTDAPGNAPAWGRLGDLERTAGDPGSALVAYDRALELFALADRQPILVRLGRARALRDAGDAAAAEAAWRGILADDPDCTPAALDLGGLLYETGRLQAAERTFAEAARRDDRAWEPRVNRSVVLSDLGRHDEALAEIRAVLRRQPTNSAALRVYAAVLEAAGNVEAARDVRRRLGG